MRSASPTGSRSRSSATCPPLYPDIQATLEATRVLVKEGFTVLPYTSDDIVFAKRLIDAGAAAVMPLGAPIGTGIGIANPSSLRMMRELITEVPLIVDAGLGTASDAALAMEMGFDAVLLNTAIAGATDPVLMASAMGQSRRRRTRGLPRRAYAAQTLRHRKLAHGGYLEIARQAPQPLPLPLN